MLRGIALIWLGATAVVSAVVGVISYQAGWAAGAAARLPAGTAAPAYYYGPHFFGFFGFLPFLFVLLVLLLVFRAGRWGWPRGGWGPRGGHGTPAGTSTGTPTPPPAGEQWREWPQRPPREEPPQGQ